MIPHRNALWATAVAEELVRSGVEDVCISPGSRSTSLVVAFHAQPGLRLTTHLDERGASYFALGAARASGRPVALLSTSGTAAANYLPGLIEANHTGLPLIVLTADRPPELHEVGANQSIDQNRLYGRHVRWFADAGLPEAQPGRVRHLRSLVCRAVAFARGPPAGPVHLNFPFREPLEPRPVAGDVPADWARGDPEAATGRPDGAPFLSIDVPTLHPSPLVLDDLARRIEAAPEGVIVCGPRTFTPEFSQSLLELARKSGYPILADPLSGLRFGPPETAPVISAYDAFLSHAPLRQRLRPAVILRFGASPTSKSLLHFLHERADALHVVVDETGRRGEETSRAHLLLPGDGTTTAQALSHRVKMRRESGSAASPWRQLDAATWAVLDAQLPQRPFEGALVARLLRVLPAEATLVVGNSLPVRDLDRFGRAQPAPLRVFGNRGASGIDGVVSTALGVAYARGRKVVLLIGDLSLLHDANGLLAAKHLGLGLDVVLFNNDGGGIFEFLPIAQYDPPFTDLFVTPHGTDFGSLARAFGFQHHQKTAAEALHGAWPALGMEGPNQLLEIVTDRKANVEHRRALESELGLHLDRVLPEATHAT